MKYNKETDISELLQMIRESDALEINLTAGSVPHKIAVRSDYEERGSSLYFARRYNLDETPYLSPLDFSMALTRTLGTTSLSIQSLRTLDQ